MNKKLRYKIISHMVLLTICLCSVAKSSLANTNVINEHLVYSKIESTDYASEAKQWGLTEADYRKYLDEMKEGMNARWWHDIDPPQVLGMNAKSDAERMKYARIDVQLDRERAVKEIAFQHAYNKAFRELYPEAKPISESKNDGQKMSWKAYDRIYLFVKVGSARGGYIASELVKEIKNISGVKVNIYFLDGASNKEIRNWAIKNQLPRNLTENGEITLNHNVRSGVSKLAELTGLKDSVVPVILRFRNNIVKRIQLEAL